MTRKLATVFVVCLCLVACGDDEADGAGARGDRATDSGAVHSKPAPPKEATHASPGKPSAPITIAYEILGKPVVGIPLSINIRIASSLDQPITVNYRINDTTSLMFADAQARSVSVMPRQDRSPASEQVTVIPQREGRLFLNVSAEIETEIGRMAKVMAIPIQVGGARPAPTVNGALTTGPDGEAVISMPARED